MKPESSLAATRLPTSASNRSWHRFASRWRSPAAESPPVIPVPIARTLRPRPGPGLRGDGLGIVTSGKAWTVPPPARRVNPGRSGDPKDRRYIHVKIFLKEIRTNRLTCCHGHGTPFHDLDPHVRGSFTADRASGGVANPTWYPCEANTRSGTWPGFPVVVASSGEPPSPHP